MRQLYYILSASGDPIPEQNALVWAKWFEGADRVVERTKVSDDVEVSTIFLGLDHGYGLDEPLLFETMIFGGSLDGTQDRYTTREAAKNGHQFYVEQARNAPA